MFFRFKPFEGPARFYWKDPDTGREFEESSKQALIDRITTYRGQNNLEPLEEISFVLESYWCGLPENKGKCVPVEGLKRGLLGYLKGGVALIQNLWYDTTVPMRVANERGAVCVECPFNSKYDVPWFEEWSNNVAIASVGEKRSAHHDNLWQCSACSCPLKAKVFYNGRIELTNEQEKVIKETNPKCWQLPEKK